MARRVLLVAAVVLSLAAVALVLVPFSARLDTVGRDGRPLEFSVVVECRAPILDAAGGDVVSGAQPPEVCTDRARRRSAGGVGAGVVGAALLVAGLRSRPAQPSRS